MDKLKALELLRELILKNKQHPDYPRTVALAKKYKALITGEGIDAYLRRFARREDEALFTQRKEITQAITPAVADAIAKPFYKVSRTNRVYQAIDTGNAEKQTIQTAIKNFWGEGEQSGLDYYMQTRFIELTFSDPNAFIAVEFEAFDLKTEKAQPKPVEITAEQALNFKYKNGVLQWLLAGWAHEYKTKEGVKTGSRYVLYLPNDAIALTEVDAKDKLVEPGQESLDIIEIGEQSAKRAFTVQYFEPKSGVVPAIRVGYKRDIFTDGRTYVSPLQPALPYFMKSIKTVSELDLSLALHTFPQKLQYVQSCPGESGQGCKEGKTRTGVECKRCKGTGTPPVATSAQDVILLPLPSDKESMVDLEKLVVYKTPPIDLIKFQDEYVDKLVEKAMRAVFNGNQFVKPTTVKTATEVDDNAEAVYDTLDPFAKRFSSVWLQIVRLIATYVEASDNLKLYHKFPSDFKLRSQASLMQELQLANTSNAPAYIVDSINADLMEIMYADDQNTLAKLKVKQKYYPFKGKTADQIQLILASDLTPKYNKVLYANFEEVFSELEQENKGDQFYLLEDSKQKGLVKAKVEALLKDMAAAAAKALTTSLPGLPNDNQEGK